MTSSLPRRLVRRLGSALGLALLSSAASVGCARQLPPAETPAPVAPAVEAAAPAEGQGRLVVDVVEGPTPIERVHMRAQRVDGAEGRVSWRFDEVPEALCPASPCVVDMAPGNILLGFPVLGDPAAMEVELVHVGAEPTVYRRSLSVYEGTGAGTVLGILGTVLGASSAVTGIALLPVGLGKDHDGLAIAGGITLGAGLALLALGIVAIDADAATYRPGSSLHFSLAD